jgi:type III secretory pathway component EscV
MIKIKMEISSQISQETKFLLEHQQKEYDDKIKELQNKILNLENIIKRDNQIGIFQKLINTTSYVNSIVDNIYFFGKIITPLYFYYKISK